MGHVMGKVLFYLLFLVFGPLLFWLEGDQLKTDYSLRSETIVNANIPTTFRYCRSKVFIWHSCSFDYIVAGENQEFNYQFFALGAPDTVFIQKGVESGRLTTTVGQDYFWHRAVTILIGFAVSGFTLLAMVAPLLFRREEEDDDFGNSIPSNWKQAQQQPHTLNPQTRNGFGQAKPQGFGRRNSSGS